MGGYYCWWGPHLSKPPWGSHRPIEPLQALCLQGPSSRSMAAAGGWTARWYTEPSAAPWPSPKPSAEPATLRNAPSLCECWEGATAPGLTMEGGRKPGLPEALGLAPHGVLGFSPTIPYIGERCRPTSDPLTGSSMRIS